jgi:hypothetical protein
MVYDTEYSEKTAEEEDNSNDIDDDDETEVLLTSDNTKNCSKTGSSAQ